MGVFDNSWLKLLHCLLWRLGEVDVWVFHKLIYEMNKEGLVEINNWLWYGDWPRSAEVDAALALFEMINVIDRSNGVIKVKRKPVLKCEELDPRIENVSSRVLNKARTETG